MKFSYEVIVVGAGHAGCEAAHAAASMGSETLLITMDMNKIAQMSCNPAVGGIAKGQIVREIDALGGGMAYVTDHTSIQFRMLNLSKGPAMWSPRSQCDRAKFITTWRGVLENTEHLYLWQDTVNELIIENKTVCGRSGSFRHGASGLSYADSRRRAARHVGARMELYKESRHDHPSFYDRDLVPDLFRKRGRCFPHAVRG